MESEVDHLDIYKLNLPIMDPQDMLGRKFIKEVYSQPHKCEVIKELDDAEYLIRVGDGQHGELLTYNKILDHANCQNNPNKYNKMFVLVLGY